jgi:c-di-GMP-related signal transduction protein
MQNFIKKEWEAFEQDHDAEGEVYFLISDALLDKTISNTLHQLRSEKHCVVKFVQEKWL